jgi:DNA-binding Lrp family transcriptional regulator
MERLNVRKLKEMGVIEQYQIIISNRSAGMETWMRARTYTGLGKITRTVSASAIRRSRSVQK